MSKKYFRTFRNIANFLSSSRYILFVTMTFLFSPTVFSADDKANLLAVGQGVSSPTSTSTVNFSSGYTAENPIGTVYQKDVRLTGEYDKNGTDGYGVELGYGNGSWGAAAGHRKRDCEDCDGRSAGAVGLTISDFGLGFRFEEDLSTIGLLFNPKGTHRLGIIAQVTEVEGDNNNLTAYALGYAYVSGDFTFALDASKLDYEDDSVLTDNLIITPGIGLRSGKLQVSVNDRITIYKNDPDTTSDNETKHDFWFGVGLGGDRFHLALYSDYVNELSLALSFFL